MDSLFLLKVVVALAPAPILLGLFAFLDVFRLMSLREISLLILLGVAAGLAAFPISGGVLDTLPIGFSDYSRFAAPWIEEVLKGLVIVGLFAVNRIGFKLDAAISGFGVGVGFAVLENILYLFLFGRLDLGVWLVRGLGTAVMHGGATALFAVVTHELTERQAREHPGEWRFEPLRYLPGLLLAGIVHALFNQFPDRPMLAMLASLLLIPMTLFLVFRFGEQESREWLTSDTEGHRKRLELLRREGFRGEEAGSIRAALERRFHGRVPPELVDEYVELHTEIVLRAEEVLHRHADGTAVELGAEDRDRLARFRHLRRQLGRSVLAALAPSLPFSRNDLWELREYQERVRRG